MVHTETPTQASISGSSPKGLNVQYLCPFISVHSFCMITCVDVKKTGFVTNAGGHNQVVNASVTSNESLQANPASLYIKYFVHCC